jgi:hypothetical protein
MNEFGPMTRDNVHKSKMIRTVVKLKKATERGELNWKIIFNDKNIKAFVSTKNYTKNKKLVISLRTSSTSLNKNDNVLKIMFKIENKDEDNMYSKSNILQTVYLNEVPSLLILSRCLNKKYLGIDFTLPTNLLTIKKDFESIPVTEVDNVIDYRKIILDVITEKARELDSNRKGWHDAFSEICQIRSKAQTCSDYNELNDYLYKVTEIIKSFNS